MVWRLGQVVFLAKSMLRLSCLLKLSSWLLALLLCEVSMSPFGEGKITAGLETGTYHVTSFSEPLDPVTPKALDVFSYRSPLVPFSGKATLISISATCYQRVPSNAGRDGNLYKALRNSVARLSPISNGCKQDSKPARCSTHIRLPLYTRVPPWLMKPTHNWWRSMWFIIRFSEASLPQTVSVFDFMLIPAGTFVRQTHHS